MNAANSIWLLLDGDTPSHWAWGHTREEALSRRETATRAVPTRWNSVPRTVRDLAGWSLVDRTLVKGDELVDLES